MSHVIPSKPAAETNMDAYGRPPIAWERVVKRLEQEFGTTGSEPLGGHTQWLATTRPSGRPLVTAMGIVAVDGRFFFTTHAASQKAKNMAHQPGASIAVAAKGLDIVVEGQTAPIQDEATLQLAAKAFATHGWAPTARDGALYIEHSASSGDAERWELYELTPRSVSAVGTAEPYGSTRWRL